MIAKRIIQKHSKKARHHFFKHVAILTKGGRIFSVAHNFDCTHAEESAVRQVWPNSCHGMTLESYRVTRTGKMAMAKPCKNCEELLRKAGIRKVKYSDSAGIIQTMKLPPWEF